MTYKKRFRKTKNHRSFRENTTHKKKRLHKTTLKKGGTATGTRIFNMLQRKGVEINDPVKQNEILSAIDSFIKTENIHTQDTGVIGRKTNALMDSVSGGVDGAIEVIGKWLIPGKPSGGKKNMSEVIVYFFPSLVKSKPGDNNKPKLRHGSIMIKTNNQYADISNYVRSMTRDTDDMLAEMVRGVTYPLGRKPYHTERFTTSERLDDGWTYTPKGDAAINLMAEKTVNDLKSELDAKKAELDTQKKELQKAKENKESHEKSAKDLKKELTKVNEDLKKNKGNEDKLRELEKEKAKIQIELGVATTNLETSKKTIDDGKASLENTTKDLNAAKEDIKVKEKEKADLEANYKKLQGEHNSLKQEKDEANKRVSKLEQESTDKEAKLIETSGKIKSLEIEKDELDRQLQDTSRSGETSKATITSITEELNKKDLDLEMTKKEKEKLLQDAEQVKAKLEKASKAAQEKEDALNAAKQDWDAVNKTTAEMKAINESEIVRLRSELQNEKHEKVQKEKQLAAEKAQKEKLATEKAQKEKELENKQRELEITNKALSDKESEFQRQQKEIQEYQTDKTAFQDSERSIIKYNIIADKIRLRLSTPPLNKITHSANPIPPAVIAQIKIDISDDDSLKKTWELSYSYDIEEKLNSIATKLATNPNYQKKYIALFSKSSASSGEIISRSTSGNGGGGVRKN